MHQAGEPALLRPLSLGEIFDRAVTLYVRNFALFSLIALVVVLPLAIMQYIAGLHHTGTFAQILDQIQHPGKASAPRTGGFDMWLVFAIIPASIGLNSVMLVAIAAAIGELYRGARPDWLGCYSYALRRLGEIIIALLGQAAALFVLFFAGTFLMVFAFFAAFLLVRLSAVLGVAAMAAAGLVVLAWLFALMLCYLAFAFAFNALGNEAAGVGRALASGFSRVFNRSELLRATLVCLALIAIYLGLFAVSASVAVLFETLHLHILNIAASALITLVSSAFLSVLLTVYYFDVRVRREGLDLQAQIEQLQFAASAR